MVPDEWSRGALRRTMRIQWSLRSMLLATLIVSLSLGAWSAPSQINPAISAGIIFFFAAMGLIFGDVQWHSTRGMLAGALIGAMVPIVVFLLISILLRFA